MRWLVLPLIFVVGCKKQEEATPDPGPSGAPASGHSVTKVNEDGSAADGSGHAATHEGSAKEAAAAPDDGSVADAAQYGGNGKPAYRDDQGHVHGPGGPIYMGRGVPCDATTNHCLRDGVWFAVGTMRPGSIYRATPAFEFESKWWDFREAEVECQELFLTKVAKANELSPGDPVIWLVEEGQNFQWLDNESDSLTSSRWEAGIIEEAASSDKFRVKGWNYSVRVDSARVVTQRKKCPNAS